MSKTKEILNGWDAADESLQEQIDEVKEKTCYIRSIYHT